MGEVVPIDDHSNDMISDVDDESVLSIVSGHYTMEKIYHNMSIESLGYSDTFDGAGDHMMTNSTSNVFTHLNTTGDMLSSDKGSTDISKSRREGIASASGSTESLKPITKVVARRVAITFGRLRYAASHH
jgi:hypothetical protein